MVPRWAHNPKAAGSTPASATKNGAVAQLGEHLPCKQRVASSILAGSTIRFEDKKNYNESFRLKSRIISFKQDIAIQKRKLI